jgi:DNA-binding beta-propeller fold protein YncE
MVLTVGVGTAVVLLAIFGYAYEKSPTHFADTCSHLIPVQNQPDALTYDSANGDLYAESYFGTDLEVINGTTNQPEGPTIAIPGYFGPSRYDPADRALYLATGYFGSNVTVLNGTTNTVAATIAMSGPVTALAVDPTSGVVFVGLQVGDRGAVIALTPYPSNLTLWNVSLGSYPPSLAFDPLNDRLYVANATSTTLDVLNGTTGSAAGPTIPTVGIEPQSLTLDPATSTLFVMPESGNHVAIVNVSSGALEGLVTVGADPFVAALDASTDTVYVADGGSPDVAVLSGNGSQVLASAVPVHGVPTGIAFDSGNGDVYTASPYSGVTQITCTAAPIPMLLGLPTPYAYAIVTIVALGIAVNAVVAWIVHEDRVRRNV